MTINEIIAAASAEAAALLSREPDDRITALAKLHATALLTRLGFADDVDDSTAHTLALAAGRLAASSLAADGGFSGSIKVGDLEIDGSSAASTALALERSADALVRLAGGAPKKRIVAVGGDRA